MRFVLFAFALALPAASAAMPLFPDHLVLNEVMPDPVGNESGREWVEIYNPLSEPVKLDGWFLTDHDARVDPLDGRVVPALGHLVVVLSEVRLANAGDDVELRDPARERVDRVVYGYGAPAQGWPRLPVPGEGASVARWWLLAPDGPATGSRTEWYVEGDPTPGASNDVHAPRASFDDLPPSWT